MRRDGALAGLPTEPLVGLPLLIAPSSGSSSAETAASSATASDSSALAPVAALPGSQQQASHGPLVRWVSKVELLAEMLDQLKRFYWSWEWPLVRGSPPKAYDSVQFVAHFDPALSP
jgi:hypothetical protein